jgi:hypothetical protein
MAISHRNLVMVSVAVMQWVAAPAGADDRLRAPPHPRFSAGRVLARFEGPWVQLEAMILPGNLIKVAPDFAAFEGRVMIALTNDLRCFKEVPGDEGIVGGENAASASDEAARQETSRTGMGVGGFGGGGAGTDAAPGAPGAPAGGAGEAAVVVSNGNLQQIATLASISVPDGPLATGPLAIGPLALASLLAGSPGGLPEAVRVRSVPEPSTRLILATALVGLGLLSRRRAIRPRREWQTHRGSADTS